MQNTIMNIQSSLQISKEMGDKKNETTAVDAGILKSASLYKYILETSVYPREPEPLKELRAATASHPFAFFGTSLDVGQLMAMLMRLVNAKKTIEIGVFTGYSLLLTALTIPSDGQITAIDPDRKTFEIGLPIIEKAGVAHKVDFIESQALPFLDKLLEDGQNEGTFDFAFVDADKGNYLNYHERVMRLVKVGGLVVYDNTLWGGSVADSEGESAGPRAQWRKPIIEFNKAVVADKRVEVSLAPLGDGIMICRRIS